MEICQLLYFKKRKYTLHDFPDAACYYYSAMGHGHEKFDQALIKKLKAKDKGGPEKEAKAKAIP